MPVQIYTPNRHAGLEQLAKFAPHAGSHYATQRNYDLGAGQPDTVSHLSPWIKHRLVSEHDVLSHVLSRHTPQAAISFVQEVFWRGYFKGWLEQHPGVWQSYGTGLAQAREAQGTDYNDAVAGRTGIACFDHWCTTLKTTGYLHNHARMWFASIWIFTLRLPWELGADFFLTHLIDGDPAANTLSWRWVGGLHTKGKTYLAQAANIARFTDGQFNPVGQLADAAIALTDDTDHPFVPFTPDRTPPKPQALLLITPQDCTPEAHISATHAGVLGLVPDRAHPFATGAVTDAVARNHGIMAQTQDWTAAILDAAQNAGTSNVITPKAAIGPIASKLARVTQELAQSGVHLQQLPHPYDCAVWPYATHGFFKLKKKIPQILQTLQLPA